VAKINMPDDVVLNDYPDDIAESDDRLRTALSRIFPDVANAKFVRNRGASGLVVNVVKQAGDKGVDPVEALKRAEAHVDPTVALVERLWNGRRVSRKEQRAALIKGVNQLRLTRAIIRRFKGVIVVPGREEMRGF
jgi:hypothetical protein